MTRASTFPNLGESSDTDETAHVPSGATSQQLAMPHACSRAHPDSGHSGGILFSPYTSLKDLPTIFPWEVEATAEDRGRFQEEPRLLLQNLRRFAWGGRYPQFNASVKPSCYSKTGGSAAKKCQRIARFERHSPESRSCLHLRVGIQYRISKLLKCPEFPCKWPCRTHKPSQTSPPDGLKCFPSLPTNTSTSKTIIVVTVHHLAKPGP